MKKNHMKLGVILVAVSIIMYTIHFAIFRDSHHLFIFLVADIAFVPLEVFFVSLVIENLMKKQEEQKIVKKMNMLVGLFYQEVGNDLLTYFVNADEELKANKTCLIINFNWHKENYTNLKKLIKSHSHNINVNQINIEKLLVLLKGNRELIINLVTNPILLEKEYFSDVLMSIFHLMDELESRDMKNMSEEDKEHLEIDAKRAYEFLSIEWVIYMEQLQDAYPYLFYTALKSNPYDNREQSKIESELIVQLKEKESY